MQMQHARIRGGIGKAGRILDWLPTGFACQLSVGLQASCSGARMAGSKLSRNVVTTTERVVHSKAVFASPQRIPGVR
jgi:hypothetical protein